MHTLHTHTECRAVQPQNAATQRESKGWETQRTQEKKKEGSSLRKVDRVTDGSLLGSYCSMSVSTDVLSALLSCVQRYRPLEGTFWDKHNRMKQLDEMTVCSVDATQFCNVPTTVHARVGDTERKGSCVRNTHTFSFYSWCSVKSSATDHLSAEGWGWLWWGWRHLGSCYVVVRRKVLSRYVSAGATTLWTQTEKWMIWTVSSQLKLAIKGLMKLNIALVKTEKTDWLNNKHFHFLYLKCGRLKTKVTEFIAPDSDSVLISLCSPDKRGETRWNPPCLLL